MKLYDKYEEAFFVERLNRFVMRLKKKDRTEINAYIANPGRMEEYLVEGHPFFITSGNKGKYNYRIVSTCYQDSFILLDTIKMNGVVETMLKMNRIEDFKGAKPIRREVKVDRSTFDFLIQRENQKPTLLEIKSCSLCHHGTAMFPDAPTERGKRHLQDLETLAQQGYDCYTLYMLNHKNTNVFMPNWHTDMDYAKTFLASKHVGFMACSIEMSDPVTLNTDVLNNVAIDFHTTQENSIDKGAYLLVLKNDKDFRETIGSLGERRFKKGYYVYVGSAMSGLSKRIKRHLSKRKKRHWHLDYILPCHMNAAKIYPVHRKDKIEGQLAEGMLTICEGYVEGFGASDSGAPSHLFYFSGRPNRERGFLNLLLDARMMLF